MMITDDKIKGFADETVLESEPKLEAIAEEVARSNGADKLTLSKEDAQRVSIILFEVQQRTFTLGVQMGIQMIMKAVTEAKNNASLPDSAA